MFRSREHAEKPPKHQPRASFRVLRRKIGNGRRLSYHEPQVRDEVHNEHAIRTQRFAQGGAPGAQLGLGLTQKVTDEALEGLPEARVWNVALVLIELA